MTTTPAVKILVADDEETNLDFFELVLKAENYAVIKARDGIEALEKFDQCQPDLVLLDLMMPRLTGYDVCTHLRRNSQAQGVPIMMLTGMDEQEVRANAYHLGIDDFLHKPVDRLELLIRVRSLLRLRQCYVCDNHRNAISRAARTDLTTALQQLEQARTQLQSRPDPALTTVIANATAACQRLDDSLHQLESRGR